LKQEEKKKKGPEDFKRNFRLKWLAAIINRLTAPLMQQTFGLWREMVLGRSF